MSSNSLRVILVRFFVEYPSAVLALEFLLQYPNTLKVYREIRVYESESRAGGLNN